MRGEHTSRFTLTANGEHVPLTRVADMPSGPLPDPAERFDDITQRAEPDEAIIRKLSETEASDGPGGRGSSLKSDQKRTLHVRGVCEVRPDGLLQVDQHLFQPKGSAFRYLVDPAGDSEQGRAPDPAAYISIGLGFCYMTQLGRYAAIMKKDLPAYRIIQDTFFTPGGASGGTGTAGEADPVETHVYLQTEEGTEFAEEVVTMGEQTCFLHAFCRTPLKTKVRVSEDSTTA